MTPQPRSLRLPTWSREQIRAARQTPLAPLLRSRGIALRELHDGNREPADHPGLFIKEWYWCWAERDTSGNTIDYFVEVLGMSFHDAMEAICKS